MSQSERLLEYLNKHMSITPRVALNECGIYRLSARIYDLRAAGHNIETDRITVNGKFGKAKVARYILR
jgi:hypothetical protein